MNTDYDLDFYDISHAFTANHNAYLLWFNIKDRPDCSLTLAMLKQCKWDYYIVNGDLYVKRI